MNQCVREKVVKSSATCSSNGCCRSLAGFVDSGLPQRNTHRQPHCQVGETWFTQLAPLERDGNLTENIGRRLCQVCRCRFDNLLELERLAHAARISYTRVLVARLQVQAHTHRLSDLRCKRLRVVCPCQGVEVDQHVVAQTHIAPRLNVGNLQQPRPDPIQLLGELSRPWVVGAAVHLAGKVALGKLEAGGPLQVDVACLRLGQQPLAHEHHRAVLEGCDARPLKRRLLEQCIADFLRRRQLELGHTPVGRPLGELLLELPLLHPPVCHNLADHRLREDSVHLRVGQQERDLLVAHNRAGQLLDAVDLLKVHGHRKDEDTSRVVDLLGARAGSKVFHVEEDVQARADLAAALLDELAHVLTERPSVRKEEMKAGRRLETRQVC
eukprot:4544521-Prymnesium_polylepis.2